MSDEIEVPNTPPVVEDVPLPPEPPEDPETPQSPAEAPKEADSGSTTEVFPEDVTEPSEVQEEAAPADPVVVTTKDGQTVTMPDGRVVHTRSTDAPVSNSEWQAYELTHQGDQPRYAHVPGDEAYSPYSDPAVPNSHLAQMVEREIANFAERVAQDITAEVSPIWNSLKGIYKGELDAAIATGGGSDKVMA